MGQVIHEPAFDQAQLIRKLRSRLAAERDRAVDAIVMMIKLLESVPANGREAQIQSIELDLRTSLLVLSGLDPEYPSTYDDLEMAVIMRRLRHATERLSC